MHGQRNIKIYFESLGILKSIFSSYQDLVQSLTSFVVKEGKREAFGNLGIFFAIMAIGLLGFVV